MSIKGYVLANVEVGSGAGVVEDLLAIEGLKSAQNVTGPFDVTAVVEVDDTATVGGLLISKIEAVEGIASTLTCVVTQALTRRFTIAWAKEKGGHHLPASLR